MPITHQEPTKGATFQSPSRSVTHQAEALGVTHTEPTRGINVQPTIQGAEFLSDSLHPTLENLVAHFDSRYVNGLDVANPSDESVISQWSDISGNNNNFIQATSTYQPKYRSFNRNLLTYNQATVETNTTGFDTGNASVGTLNLTLARSTAQAKQGTACIAGTALATGVSVIHNNIATLGIPVTPGKTYSATVSSRAGTTGTATRARIRWYKANGDLAVSGGFSDGSDTVNSTSAWTTHTATGVCPSDAVYASAGVRFTSVTISQIMYADEWGLWEGASTAWIEPVKVPTTIRPVVQCHSRACLRAGVSADWDFASGTTGQVSVYVVASPEADPNSYCNLIHTNGWSSSNDGFSLRHRNNENIEGVHSSGVVSTNHLSASGGTGSTTGNWHVYAMTINAATPLLKASCDGVVFTDTTPATTPGDPPHNQHPLTIGTFSPGAASTLYNNLSYAEVLVYSVAHDDATRQSIEHSLGSQYGITVA